MGTMVILGAGFIFLVNGVFMLGKIEKKGTAMVNAAIGSLMFILCILIGSKASDPASSVLAGLSMTFALFYLILAGCILGNFDFKAMGWYCLGAGIFVLLCAFYFAGVDIRMLIFDLSWAVLFFAVFVNLVLGKALDTFIGWLLILESFTTLLIPAFLMMMGRW